MTSRILVTGGARSGKSRWAEQRLGRQPVRYVATGYPPGEDVEWAARVELHRQRRPGAWETIETADAATVLRTPDARPVLVDCVTLWLTRVLDEADAWQRPAGLDRVAHRVDDLVSAFVGSAATAVLVTNEVGWGVVPPTPAGRLFADLLGAANARLAEAADQVVLTVAGQPLQIKPPQPAAPQPAAPQPTAPQPTAPQPNQPQPNQPARGPHV
jgi:adenosylcobinamide kinase/adenosylcobinamide-phosphate guanylyltransferase